MIAIRETLPKPEGVVFSRCSVIDAPHDLPNGDYTVTFGACRVPARKEAGLWVPNEERVAVLPARQLEKPGLRDSGDGAFALLRAIKKHVA